MPNEEYLNESLKKVVKGVGFGFIGAFIGRIFGYFTRIVLARFLGADYYGLLNLGLAVFGIATAIAALGLGSGVVRYVSYHKGRGEEGKIKGTIYSALKITLPVAFAFSFLLYLGSDWLALHVFHDAALSPVLKIFSFAIPFTIVARDFISATIGFQDLKYNIYVHDISENALRLSAIVILLSLGFGIVGAAWGWCIATMTTPFLAFYFLEKRVFHFLRTKKKPERMGKELLSFSWPLVFVGFSGLLLEWTDTLMLGYFCTSSEVGIYNAALPTARLIQTIPGIFAVIFMPVISELFARGRYEDIKHMYSIVTKWILSLVIPASLLMVLFAPAVLRVIFGTDYIGGASALVILTAGYLFFSFFGLTDPILGAYGQTKIIMSCIFLTATLNVILNMYLIPIYGIAGAALATSSSFAFWGIVQFLFVHRITKLQPFRFNYLKPVGASILAILIIYPLTKYLIGPSFFALVGMLFAFILIYFFMLLVIKGFEEEDLMIMRAIDQRLGTKSNLVREVIKRFL
jgi:O-antigen/teichoic acid export membrane protein